MFAGKLAINLLAAEGETSPFFVYNGESSSYCHMPGQRRGLGLSEAVCCVLPCDQTLDIDSPRRESLN